MSSLNTTVEANGDGQQTNFAASYRDEASDLLADLEVALIELEIHPGDADLIGRVFRNLHTIKGSGAMFGFEKVASFTHQLESSYSLVRDGKLAVTPILISLTLLGRDHISALLNGVEGEQMEQSRDRIVSGLLEFQTGVAPDASRNSDPLPCEPVALGNEAVYRVRFRPAATVFRRAINLLSLFAEARSLGACSVICQTRNLPDLDEFEVDSCYVSWDLEITTDKGEAAVLGLFEFVDEDLEVEAVSAAQPAGQSNVAVAISAEPAPLEENGPETTAEAEPEATVAPKRTAAKAEPRSLRVSAERLDDLVNIVGEVVTLQARLSQVASLSGFPEVAYVAEEMERLTDKLRDNTMSIRMLPIGATFGNCRRLVRDLARDLGKSVDLITEGGDTELDKTVIDRINDPLVHLIRNCVDHGLETPEMREAAGKSKTGKIVLNASHSGAHVLIQMTDDGAGINKEAIRRKALEKGLIKSDHELSDEEMYSLILSAGFSTAKTLSDVSGRGVGMDVVKQNVEALNGTLEISSKQGKGTSFILKLPLTLAIIDGLLVKVADQYFVLPLSNILECVELSAEAIRANHERKFVVLRGEMVPYVEIRKHFEIAGERPSISQVMIAETVEGKFGFLVDNVIGDHKTVIKKLGGLYKNVESVSGATILGNGTVALILDLNKLAKVAVLEDRERHRELIAS